jgi:DNA-binding FadR family transcriptional regulator
MRSKSGNLDRLRRMHLPMNGKAQSILDEHTQIAHYIGQGDAEKARDHVREHLSGTLHVLNALREKNLDDLLPENYSLEAFSNNYPN